MPLEITISVGQRVLFVNNDTRPHTMSSDPPGQQRETGIFTSARTCDYHDHTALGVPAFSGRIIIR